MERIFLIGYMGVGKTTIGKVLAQKLELEFVDLDQFIQMRHIKTISQLFEEFGEVGFREIERKSLKEVAAFENVVVSTGGGTPCFFDNMDYMNEMGKTIYLKASPQLLSERLNTSKEKRPLIKDKNEAELYSFVADSLMKREPFYSKARFIYANEELIGKEDVDLYIDKLIKKIR